MILEEFCTWLEKTTFSSNPESSSPKKYKGGVKTISSEMGQKYEPIKLTEREAFIKSPLNYTGNKYRILNQIEKYFPKNIHCMIDLFCGGATVGINTNAEKVIFIDCNEKVLNLLNFLSKQNFSSFLNECEKLITKYSLSYSYKNGYKNYRKLCSDLSDNNGLKDYNTKGFYQLRNDYNNLMDKNSSEANFMLYILMVYGFNNDLRFNSFGDYNLPIWKIQIFLCLTLCKAYILLKLFLN